VAIKNRFELNKHFTRKGGREEGRGREEEREGRKKDGRKEG
jgi:hypothetical protein